IEPGLAQHQVTDNQQGPSIPHQVEGQRNGTGGSITHPHTLQILLAENKRYDLLALCKLTHPPLFKPAPWNPGPGFSSPFQVAAARPSSSSKSGWVSPRWKCPSIPCHLERA